MPVDGGRTLVAKKHEAISLIISIVNFRIFLWCPRWRPTLRRRLLNKWRITVRNRRIFETANCSFEQNVRFEINFEKSINNTIDQDRMKFKNCMSPWEAVILQSTCGWDYYTIFFEEWKIFRTIHRKTLVSCNRSLIVDVTHLFFNSLKCVRFKLSMFVVGTRELSTINGCQKVSLMSILSWACGFVSLSWSDSPTNVEIQLFIAICHCHRHFSSFHWQSPSPIAWKIAVRHLFLLLFLRDGSFSGDEHCYDSHQHCWQQYQK